jgi:xylitol oxidase
LSEDAAHGPITNWAGNIRFRAARLHEPTSVEALQAIVGHADQVRALGTGHSFNRIADTDGDLVSVSRLPPVMDIDTAARTVRVSGGTRYGELGAALQAAGLALPNTGSLPHISIAGACATGTHGSGRTNTVLGRIVRAVTMVTAGGDVVRVDRESAGESFEGHVVALGRLGIVTELELEVVPTFDVAQSVVVGVTDDVVSQRIQEILAAAYSVSIFTTYGPDAPDANRVWLKARTDADGDGPDLAAWGGHLADEPHHPVPGMPAEFATAQLGEPGPWNERLPHFRLDFTPSSGDELQSEYLLPLDQAQAAWGALLDINDQIHGELLIGEVRCVAADSMWLSATGGQDCVAFHFTWAPELEPVLTVLREIERRLMPLGARPHWGKVFAVPARDLAPLYPRLADFRELVAQHDPEGKLGNDLVDGWIGLA